MTTIPNIEWFGDNIFSVTGEYYGIEKTIEKEFTVFLKKGGGAGITQTGANDCGLVSPVDIGTDDRSPQDIVFSNDGRKMIVADRTENKIYDYFHKSKIIKNYFLIGFGKEKSNEETESFSTLTLIVLTIGTYFFGKFDNLSCQKTISYVPAGTLSILYLLIVSLHSSTNPFVISIPIILFEYWLVKNKKAPGPQP